MDGTEGNDIINGGNNSDKIGGAAGSDTISGGEGNDTLEGGGGGDTLTGGKGQDTFLGSTGDLNGDTITDLQIGDRIGVSGATVNPDTISSTATTISFNGGTDVTINAVLPAGATLRLLDEKLEDGGSILEVVGQGQDIAFVIDTTGSMWDDIANVKASATDIINSIFDPERGLTDSRIAVVGFNDPTTETILSFTDQNDPDDRKTAALNAINSISVFGGGDFPEMTYSGLLRALDGRAGEWREDAVARKIILFGDATAKDTYLRDQVIALANDLDASVSAREMSSVGVTDDIDLTTVSLRAESADGSATTTSIQIFTVAIGGNSGTIAEYESISSATGGEDFTATGAADIVETLLEVINLPIYAISRSTDTVTEGDDGTTTIEFTLQRDVATEASEVTVLLLGTADDADRTPVSFTVSFEAGQLVQTLQVNVLGDTDYEQDEVITATIDSVTESATIGTSTASTTILNDDKLIGSSSADLLTGGDGDDTISGRGGDDTIDGGAGSDTITGGGGDDEISGGRGLDSISGGAGEDFIQGGTREDTLSGGDDNDRIVGQRNADSIDGGSGDDNLKGGGGNDTINGGDDNDFIKGGTRADVLHGGEGDDRIFANSFADVLNGEAGNDLLNAGGDNDTLNGGTGNDTLKGGGGADTFVFEADMGADVVLDFQDDTDVLQIASALTGGDTDAASVVSTFASVVGGNTVFDFGGGNTITLNGVIDETALVDDLNIL